MQSNHPEQDSYCVICKQSFHNKEDWQKHNELKHSFKRQFVCNICKKSFGLHKSLHRHVHYFHEKIKDPQCEICTTKFRDNFALKSILKLFMKNRKTLCVIFVKRIFRPNFV